MSKYPSFISVLSKKSLSKGWSSGSPLQMLAMKQRAKQNEDIGAPHEYITIRLKICLRILLAYQNSDTGVTIWQLDTVSNDSFTVTARHFVLYIFFMHLLDTPFHTCPFLMHPSSVLTIPRQFWSDSNHREAQHSSCTMTLKGEPSTNYIEINKTRRQASDFFHFNKQLDDRTKMASSPTYF